MLKVYLDRGAKSDSDDSILSVASAIFKPIGYKQFLRPWNRMLRGWRASAFHATDFYNGAKGFKRDTPAKKERFDSDSKHLPKLVGENVQRILVVATRPEEFLREAPGKWKNLFAYFRESGDEDDAEVANTVERMGHDHPDTARLIRVASFARVARE